MPAGRVAAATPLRWPAESRYPDDVWLSSNAGLKYADAGDDTTARTWLMVLTLPATGDPERLVDRLCDLRII